MHGIEPTFIQGLNVDVDKINKNALKKLNLEKQKDGILLDFYEYEMSIENDYNLPDYIVLHLWTFQTPIFNLFFIIIILYLYFYFIKV